MESLTALESHITYLSLRLRRLCCREAGVALAADVRETFAETLFRPNVKVNPAVIGQEIAVGT